MHLEAASVRLYHVKRQTLTPRYDHVACLRFDETHSDVNKSSLLITCIRKQMNEVFGGVIARMLAGVAIGLISFFKQV